MLVDIEAAARRVADAKHCQSEAAAAVDAAKAAAAAVQGRVDALQAERAGLVAAARAGDADGSAGLRIAVIDADVADLAPLMADAKAHIQRADSDAAKVFQAVAAAERDLAVERDRETEAMLIDRVENLAQLLTTGLAELKSLQKRRGGRPSWAPQTGLVRELTSLRLTADNRQIAAA